MKKIFTLALVFSLIQIAAAQNNSFPSTGWVGIGTTSPSAILNISNQYAQIKLEGSNYNWLGSDLILSRTSSGTQLTRSPNILFYDAATNSSAFIQSFQGNLQFYPGGGAPSLTLSTSGYVGVNATTPASPLQVGSFGTKFNIGSANTTSLNGTSYLGFNAARLSTTNVWRFDGNASGDGGAVIYSDVNGSLNFAAVPTSNGTAYFERTDDQLKGYIALQVTSSGVVRAKQIKVETTGWPDFVFDKRYHLSPLESVSKFIEKNHHLPEMPAAKEIEANGQDLGAMNKLLLKKVEELTIYLIEEHKTNLKLQNMILKDRRVLKKQTKQVAHLIKNAQGLFTKGNGK